MNPMTQVHIQDRAVRHPARRLVVASVGPPMFHPHWSLVEESVAASSAARGTVVDVRLVVATVVEHQVV